MTVISPRMAMPLYGGIGGNPSPGLGIGGAGGPHGSTIIGGPQNSLFSPQGGMGGGGCGACGMQGMEGIMQMVSMIMGMIQLLMGGQQGGAMGNMPGGQGGACPPGSGGGLPGLGGGPGDGQGGFPGLGGPGGGLGGFPGFGGPGGGFNGPGGPGGMGGSGGSFAPPGLRGPGDSRGPGGFDTPRLPGGPNFDGVGPSLQNPGGQAGNIINWAERHLGLNERDHGGYIRNNFSRGRNQPWCADFVSTAFAQNGGSPFGHISSVAGLQQWGIRNNRYFSRNSGIAPQPGDIMIQRSNGASHTGIVTGISGGRLHTIEGNSSDAVRQRSYSLNDPRISGYVRATDGGNGTQYASAS